LNKIQGTARENKEKGKEKSIKRGRGGSGKGESTTRGGGACEGEDQIQQERAGR
jgi:hypothetical protein